ncbi:MAG: helix-turn-helix domain-containing protein, partial [Candidatus Cryptobacteroides sp.]
EGLGVVSVVLLLALSKDKYDADSAFLAVKKDAPDIVISDVMMPGKSGYDLCREIKGSLQLSHIPVILLTAKANVDDQVQGLDCGADAYVTKPFEPQYLMALANSQIKNREKIKSMLSQATEVGSLDDNVLSEQDNAFMKELYELMEKELSNDELDVTGMTERLHISRTKFYYKVKGLTGENPSVFFKRYKLNRAAQLLKEHKYNISEIADMTGFSTLSHFSTSFKKQFGVSPSEYNK